LDGERDEEVAGEIWGLAVIGIEVDVVVGCLAFWVIASGLGGLAGAIAFSRDRPRLEP
jgi:hypothetical protein